MAPLLVERGVGAARIADAAYDATHIIVAIEAQGATPVIPSNPTRKQQRAYDRALYWLRHRVEIFFHRLKSYRRIATRYEKTERNYSALLHLVCALTWVTP